MATKIVTSNKHLPWAGYYVCMGAKVEDLDPTPWMIGSATVILLAVVVVMVTYRVMKQRWLCL